MTAQKTEYFASLEGIRGYAFLAVFLLHYNVAPDHPANLLQYTFYLCDNLGWFLVPIFFVLSGFLITRILIATREREGYFRVFYQRRAVRILPLYYTVVGLVLVISLTAHWTRLLPHQLLYFTYLQNFTNAGIGNKIWLDHFWSLAVEEQFYLFWPLAIWFLRSEKSILNFSFALMAVCFFFRLTWPMWGIPFSYGHSATPSRVDGILLGAVLAIYYKRTTHWDRYVLAARIGIPVLLCGMLALTLLNGSSSPNTYLGIALGVPAMNLIGLGFVILALTPQTRVAKICSGSLICKFGQLSYGLYVLHFLYVGFFIFHVLPALQRHMPALLAQLVTDVLALGFTTGLAIVTYKLIEEPAMKLKDKFHYGPKVERPAGIPWFGRPRLALDSAE